MYILSRAEVTGYFVNWTSNHLRALLNDKIFRFGERHVYNEFISILGLKFMSQRLPLHFVLLENTPCRSYSVVDVIVRKEDYPLLTLADRLFGTVNKFIYRS